MPRARAQALCDDVENAVGDVLCDGFDELEAILAAEETVALAPEKIREVRVPRQPAPRAPALAVALTRARPQGVDRVMYKFQKHAVDNCRVFKSYSLQQIFGISPQVAERSRAPAGLQPSAPGVHTSEEEQAIDAELAQLRERAHAVRRPTRIALVVSPRAGFLTARARFFAVKCRVGRPAARGERAVAAAGAELQALGVALFAPEQRCAPACGASSPGTHERAGVVRSDAHAGRCGGNRQAG